MGQDGLQVTGEGARVKECLQQKEHCERECMKMTKPVVEMSHQYSYLLSYL